MASGPRLTVPQADLGGGVQMPDRSDQRARRRRSCSSPGTGATGDQGYLIGQDAFKAYGHPVCYVNFPDFTTADIQISVQYLVYGLRSGVRARRTARSRSIGISQGGLLPRFALTYWPDLRRKVSDVLAAAGTQHGTTVGLGSCSASSPCPPADWQQGAGSNLLRALNSQPDETPGNVSYTTVRSLTDETVQPQSGKHPTLGARGRQQHPHPERLPRPHDQPHRHRRRLGHVRRLRRRGRPRRQGETRRGQGLTLSP